MYKKWCNREIDSCSLKDMTAYLKNTKSLSSFKKGMTIKGKNRMNTFEYALTEHPAKTASDMKTTFILKSGKKRTFAPHLHPREMLELGIFDGKMLNDCLDEFPREWFEPAIKKKKLSPEKPDVSLNLYKIHSRQSRIKWQEKKWIMGDDERGWFQWFCRYALGRRDPKHDPIQMKRWRAIARWRGAFEKNNGRTIIQQTLLQWSWPHIP